MRVPTWIKNSEMYKNREDYDFPPEDETPLYDLKLRNMKDFKNILKTIKFWQIDSPYPREIWEFILSNRDKVKHLLEKKKH